MKAVSYFRYSTDNRQQRDNSELRQKDSVEALIVRKGWIPVEEVIDRATSGADDKPQLIDLQRRLEQGDISFDVIVIDNLNRLTRRHVLDMYKDVGWLENNSIKLSIVDRFDGRPITIEELARDLSLVVTGAMNHEKVQETSSKVRDGMLSKFQRGQLGWMGKAPYGYKFKKVMDEPRTLVPDEDFPIIKEMLQYFIKKKSVRGCVDFLNKTKRFVDNPGKVPSSNSAKNLLRASIYCGIRTIGVRGTGKYNTIRNDQTRYIAESPLVQAAEYRDYNPEGFEPAITVEEFKTIQRILDGNQKVYRKRPAARKHSYSGLFRCGSCGDSMCAASYRAKDGGILIRYVCPSSQNTKTKKCITGEKPYSKAVREDEVEELLINSFQELFLNKKTHVKNINRLVEDMNKAKENSKINVDNDLEIQQDRLAKIQEVYFQVGGDKMGEAYKEQAILVKELEDKAKEEEDKENIPNSVLAIAKRMWEEGKSKEGNARYLGFCYMYAAKAIKEKNKRKRTSLINGFAAELRDTMLLSYEFLRLDDGVTLAASDGTQVKLGALKFSPDLALDDFGRTKVKEWVKSSQKSKATRSRNPLIGKSKEILKLLNDMSLEHCLVQFERGLWRGKPRNTPIALDFVFSVTGNGHTDRSAVLISYRSLSSVNLSLCHE